jgi:hypothetical protein
VACEQAVAGWVQRVSGNGLEQPASHALGQLSWMKKQYVMCFGIRGKTIGRLAK